MSRLSVFAVVLTAAVGLAGCYGAGRYALQISASNDPSMYSAAFADAVTFRMVRVLTGRSYEETGAGDLRFAGQFAEQKPCKLEELPDWTRRSPDILVRGRGMGSAARCHLAGFASVPACQALDGCLAIAIDPMVLGRYRTEIADALSQPCQAIETPAGEVRGRRGAGRDAHGPLTWHGAAWNRRVLRCDTASPITGTLQTIDIDSGIIVVRF